MRKKLLYGLFLMLPFAAAAQALTGTVASAAGEPLADVSLRLQHGGYTFTGDDGRFSLRIAHDDSLFVTLTGYTPLALFVHKDMPALHLVLEAEKGRLADVVVNTGYQLVAARRATGSVDVVDNALLNRAVSPGILQRLENNTPGLLFNHGQAAATDPFLIRGRSTIYANAQPLVVLDNFPYDGDINAINPNDIASVSILKDAAAAAIWGARAGNGVIVINTKKGRAGRTAIDVTSTVTVQGRPGVFNISQIAPADYIAWEKDLFSRGYYKPYENFITHPPLTPLVELLIAARDGQLSPAEADKRIAALAGHDVRSDIQRYFYRPSVKQQHALSLSGATPLVNYYLSAGYDRSLNSLAGQAGDRVTLLSRNVFTLLPGLQAETGVSYTGSTLSAGNNPGYSYYSVGSKRFYPYADLTKPVSTNYRQPFIEAAQAAGLLDWSYSPVADISQEDNRTVTTGLRANAGLSYKLPAGFSIAAKYQYTREVSALGHYYNAASFYARHQVNSFTQVDGAGKLSYPVPQGGIDDRGSGTVASHQGRLQGDYTGHWAHGQSLVALAGFEVRSLQTTQDGYRLYGYDPAYAVAAKAIDYKTLYPLYGSYLRSQVSNGIFLRENTDRFRSFYANAAYTFLEKYTVSGSARKDEANLFGVQTNRRGTPLWSAGFAWQALAPLKVRASYGVNGNISRQATADPTASYNTAFTTPFVTATLQNPPNASLRWERVKQLNLGADFNFKGISGTVDVYHKHAADLIGQAPLDPTYGSGDVSQPAYYGNVAEMKGTGVDLSLTSRNLTGAFSWQTTLIFSYAQTKVTKYLAAQNTSGSAYYITYPNSINPVAGRPVYSMYAYRWAGLDPQTGDPMGYVDGKPSKNWGAIYSGSTLDSMVYKGPVQPTVFGALRNSFSWKQFSLSFTISYKFGYVFRENSLSYSDLLSTWRGTGDYARRWQKPGDELVTHVPSFVYPVNTNRDRFYQNAEVLVAPADNIRLEDISLSYTLHAKARFFLYASNLGVLWVKNKEGIDPYYNNIPKEAAMVAAGVNFHF